MNKHTTFWILFIIALLNACQNTQPKEGNAEEVILEKQQTKDSLTIEVRQLDENTYILNDKDTIQFKKPILKFFTGKLGYEDVQLWLFYCIPMGEAPVLSYSYEGFWCINGNPIERISFSKDNNMHVAKFHKDEKETEPLIVLEYIESSGRVVAKSNAESCILTESDLTFDAYDCFVYEDIYCNYWNYTFSYIENTIPPEFQTCFQKAIIPDDSNSDVSSIKDWKHHINPVVRKASIDDEDDSDPCFGQWDQTYTLPMYLDSVVYVISSFGHVYMGGAHGMFFTTYNCYDTQSGEQLVLEDIIDTENELFEEFYTKKMKMKKEFGLENFESVEMPSSFYIVPRGILFYYPGYSLGGGWWPKESFFTFEELKPYLKRNLYSLN